MEGRKGGRVLRHKVLHTGEMMEEVIITGWHETRFVSEESEKSLQELILRQQKELWRGLD